jgi:hypothetical protein
MKIFPDFQKQTAESMVGVHGGKGHGSMGDRDMEHGNKGEQTSIM